MVSFIMWTLVLARQPLCQVNYLSSLGLYCLILVYNYPSFLHMEIYVKMFHFYNISTCLRLILLIYSSVISPFSYHCLENLSVAASEAETVWLDHSVRCLEEVEMVQGAIVSSWHLQIKHSWLLGLSLSDVVVKQRWQRSSLCFTLFLA